MFFLDHIWLIPLLPAFGAAMMFFFGRKLQKATVSAVCVGVVVLAFLFACGAVWQYTDYAHDQSGQTLPDHCLYLAGQRCSDERLASSTGRGRPASDDFRHARWETGCRSRPT